jgi:hydroxyethylthiazole kinase-like uncharacterized protein yjeF
MTAALYDVPALRAIEAAAAAQSGDDYDLMRRAGEAAWRTVADRWPAVRSLLVVCGPGNNGGDGYVLARHARAAGLPVCVMHLPEHAPRSPLAIRACDEYIAAGGAVRALPVLPSPVLPEADLLVDALFGIGLDRRAVQGDVAALIEAINRFPAPVLALDVPSGLDAQRGSAPGRVVAADCTIEFIAPKPGLRTGHARDVVGELRCDTLGIDSGIAVAGPAAVALQRRDLARWLVPRRNDSHKGHHGRVLCVGGEHGRAGAILMAAEAVLRSGAGLVDVATRAAHLAPLLARLPEAMAHAVADDGRLPGGLVDSADVVLLGPGLGQDAWGERLFETLVAAGKPLVLDADALNLLAGRPRPLPAAILTPHPGEAARLLDLAAADVQRDRFHAAGLLTERYGAHVVLKGAGTVVASRGEVPRLIDAGNPGMAVGGMGDVLAGVIASLYAQGLQPFDAAACGALLHAAAGDAAAAEGGQRGLLPTDLMSWLRRLANPENAV